MSIPNTPPVQADINLDLTVNEIVGLWPSTLPVLHRLGLDSCCGGSHPLRMVIERHGLETDAVVNELRQAVGTAR